MAIEIVSFPINSMVDLSIVFCKRLPEGNISPLNPLLDMLAARSSVLQRVIFEDIIIVICIKLTCVKITPLKP